MKTTELTDIDGDALTITQRLDATWITCTKGNEEVTIGPVPTDAIRHAFQEPMGGDDMDGGVTAALVEKEAATLSPELLEAALAAALKDNRELTRERDDARGDCNDALRREKAEQDRAVKAETALDNKAAAYDQLKVLFGRAERAAIRWKARAEQDRPLTADEVPDAMVLPMLEALGSREKGKRVAQHPAFLVSRIRHGLAAALAIDPSRPAGAEQLDPLVDRAIRGCSDITSPETVRAIANGLAEEGVFVAGAPTGHSTGPHVRMTAGDQA